MTASNSRTVVPGDWFGIFGDDVSVLLPPSAKSRVAALWEAVDDGAGFDELLDSLIRDGLRDLPGFVLVSAEGSDVKVVIRGAASASFATNEGPVEVSGSPDSTWVERTLSGVSGLTVAVGEGDGTSYAVGAGLLRVSRVEQSLGEAQTSNGTSTPAPVVESVVQPVPEPASEPEVAAVTPAPAVAAPVPPPVMGEPTTDPLAPEPQPHPEPAPEPTPAATPAATPEPAPGPHLEPEPVVAAPVVPAPVVPAPALPPGDPFAGGFPPPAQPVPQLPSESTPAPPPSPAVVSPEIDEDTQAASGLAPEDLTPTPDPAAGPAPAVTARSVARLIFSSGETVAVDRSVLVGRAPEPRNFSATDQPHVVTVPSPNQEISSTHLEIRPGTAADHGTAVATDLGSTNGTVVVQPGLPPEDLQPGIAVQLIPGAILDLGEGVTIQVTGA